MNRAERRHREKLGNQKGGAGISPEVKALFTEAVAHHQAQRFQQAEQLYRRILALHPSHADALHLLGLIAYQQGDHPSAIDLISKAIQYDPKKPHYLFNLGLAFQKIGNLPEAVSSYKQALALKPNYREAQSNLGHVFRELGHLDEAIEAFKAVLQHTTDSADAHNNLGVALKEQGMLDQAIEQYRAALRVNPRHAEAHNNLGIALKDTGNLDAAIASFQQAIEHSPKYGNAHYHLGLTLFWQQHGDEALACFRQSADILQNHGRPVQGRSVAKARIKHDCEQMHYLRDHRISSDESSSYVETLTSLRARSQNEEGLHGRLTIDPQMLVPIAPSFNRILHYAQADAVPGGALNQDLDVTAIEARYHEKKPEIIYVDHLLSETALSTLRQFCLESTIWKRDYQRGYIGTFLAEGFSCPLLLQIVEDLRTRFPRIFRDHLLTQAWAFKYDSELQGLNMHADAAAVNVNFWITPDEANLDPSSGGLTVWDKEAPDSWDFKEYNNDNKKQKIQEYLEQSQAKAITIPHRQNRAIIFNSNLFHETDKVVFRDEYECRRINVTLLYGYRQMATPSTR